jgi:acyl-CoA synthetase (AMP-forming)/AMP-acid ligase II/thioesterase domain-containing protein
MVEEEHPLTVHEIIGVEAARNPGAPALLAPRSAPLTYSQLHVLVRRTAEALNQAGVGLGDRVAVVLPNGPEMAAAFCAISSSAVCAPLNPAYGREEFDFFLTDLEPSLLVTQESFGEPAVEVARSRGVPVAILNPAASGRAGDFMLTAGRGAPPRRPGLAGAGDVALMLHTSGTASRPKLVPLRHRNLCLSARNIRRTLRLGTPDCCLNIMPLFHIHGLVAAVLASLSAGASVVCTAGFQPVLFFTWLENFRATWYTAVPTLHQAILARAEVLNGAPLNHRLRFLRSSSAPLAAKVMSDLEDLFQVPVVEAYGMTEAAHQIASNPLPPGARKPGSVGLPAGPDVAIGSELGQLLPNGEKGEVVIRGGNVTLGYEKNDAANKTAFPDGWFRTGDQGCLDPDGYLFLTGRLKEIINRGGEKISPRELDDVLLEHPGILQAVTFAIPHVQLGEDVGVAVVLKEGVALTETQIRQYAATRLAGFKVPRVVRIVGEIPKGSTGKLQRIGLAAKLGVEPVDDGRLQRRAAFEAPRNTLERQLAEIWQDVLGTGRIGIHDGFAAVGGTSVQVPHLLAQVCEVTGVAVSLIGFLEKPTIAGMAGTISQAGPVQADRAKASLLVPIQPSGGRPPVFCAPGHDNNLVPFGYLAQLVGPDQPLFGFDFAAVDANGSLEDLASRCLSTLRSRQPEGPYWLVGSCFGGKVLYETACQLIEQGQDVSLLLLINCFNEKALRRGAGAGPAATWRRLLWRVRYHWSALAQRTLLEKLVYLRSRAAVALEDDVMPKAYNLFARLGAIPPFLRRHDLRNRYLAGRWEPRPFEGPSMLIWNAVAGRRLPLSPRMGWEGLLPEDAEVHAAPDNRLRFWVEPNVRFVATHLMRRLESAKTMDTVVS